MKSAWLKLVALTLASALAIPACKITTGDDDDDIFEGGRNSGGRASGGTTATGGKASGGTTTGGTTATGGATSTGGTTVSGGTTSTGGTATGGTEPFSCMTTESRTPGESCNLSYDGATAAEEACFSCLASECCTQIKACLGENPRNQCQGSEKTGWEVGCIQQCLLEVIEEKFDYDQDDEDECAGQCAAENNCIAIADTTQDAFVCLKTNCEDECLFDLAM